MERFYREKIPFGCFSGVQVPYLCYRMLRSMKSVYCRQSNSKRHANRPTGAVLSGLPHFFLQKLDLETDILSDKIQKMVNF